MRRARFFGRPFGASIGKPFPVRGEKATAMFPEQRPDNVAVRLGNVQRRNPVSRKETKVSFAMLGRAFAQTQFHFKKKDEPMARATVGVFTHDGSEVQIACGDFQAKLLTRLAAGAGVRRFAFVGVDLAAARTPEAAVGFLGAFEQQDFIALIEHVKQGGDFVRQPHARD